MYYKEAASLAVNRMYTNIYTFSGGLKAWKAAGYEIAQSNPLPAYEIETIDAPAFKQNFADYCIVDIRMRKHYAMGLYTKHLKEEMTALSSPHRKKYVHKIPLPHLTRMYKKVPLDRTVVVLDYKGKQAGLAANYLRHVGHKKVCTLKGGLASFER